MPRHKLTPAQLYRLEQIALPDIPKRKTPSIFAQRWFEFAADESVDCFTAHQRAEQGAVEYKVLFNRRKYNPEHSYGCNYCRSVLALDDELELPTDD